MRKRLEKAAFVVLIFTHIFDRIHLYIKEVWANGRYDKEGLTEEEKHEQAKLRREYVKGFRKDLISQLNNVTLKNPDGSLTHLRDKGIKE